jgi:hypothetical protein
MAGKKGVLALLYTFLASLAVVIFFWLVGIPLENFTPEKIVLVIVISVLIGVILILNLSKFLKKHGYGIQQMHLVLEEKMAANDKDFIFRLQRLIFLHIMTIGFIGALIFVHGEITAAIIDFISLFAFIFALSPIFFNLAAILFVLPLHFYGVVRGKNILGSGFFVFWTRASILVTLFVLVARMLAAQLEYPETLHFLKILLNTFKNSETFWNMLNMSLLNILFGIAGIQVLQNRRFIYLIPVFTLNLSTNL